MDIPPRDSREPGRDRDTLTGRVAVARRFETHRSAPDFIVQPCDRRKIRVERLIDEHRGICAGPERRIKDIPAPVLYALRQVSQREQKEEGAYGRKDAGRLHSPDEDADERIPHHDGKQDPCLIGQLEHRVRPVVLPAVDILHINDFRHQDEADRTEPEKKGCKVREHESEKNCLLRILRFLLFRSFFCMRFGRYFRSARFRI